MTCRGRARPPGINLCWGYDKKDLTLETGACIIFIKWRNYMNDIQFEAFSLYAGMRMDGMSKLDAFMYTIRCLLPEEEYPNGYDDGAIELYTWLREKVKLD